jgi:hypothetical protein
MPGALYKSVARDSGLRVSGGRSGPDRPGIGPRVGRFVLAAAIAAIAVGGVRPAALDAQRKVQRLSGLSVAPVYDGYEANPDGTFSMWFGYFNRNQAEHFDVPVGPGNRFEPGAADRGQPTHFVPAWQKSAFRIVVPRDFGEQRLTWTLTTHGKTESVVAWLDPRSIIDRRKTTIENTVGENLAPEVRVEPATLTVGRNGQATITVFAKDDGLPVNGRTKQPEGLTVQWRKYRGPASGRVTFMPPEARLADGTSSTAATFSEPGEYVLHAVVDDGSRFAGTYCCWISAEAKVTVKP